MTFNILFPESGDAYHLVHYLYFSSCSMPVKLEVSQRSARNFRTPYFRPIKRQNKLKHTPCQFKFMDARSFESMYVLHIYEWCFQVPSTNQCLSTTPTKSTWSWRSNRWGWPTTDLTSASPRTRWGKLMAPLSCIVSWFNYEDTFRWLFSFPSRLDRFFFNFRSFVSCG